MFKRRLLPTLALAAVTTGALGFTSAPPALAASVEIQILGINDFHGRLLPNANATPDEVGAAELAGAVDALETAHPNTVFAAAGDLIGASTFESFIAQDKPTIDVFNEMGLDVSAVGNHEFDQGYDDLVNRVMAPEDPVTNPRGGALWEYLGANVRNSTDNSPALPETWTQDFGGVTVGFVGAVTDDLPSLVSPAGIEGLTIEAPVVAANRSADALKAAGADLVILLVHEGAATTDISSATDPNTNFGQIVNGANANIDAIISGHTHLPYNHQIPVAAWAGRQVTSRPVVSAGQYGAYLNQLLFTVDDVTGQVTGLTANLLALETDPSGPDAAVAQIVTDAVNEANTLGAAELGQIAGPFYRGQIAAGNENRGAESTLGNIVAEAQRWATESETFGAAEIAFMNPGGLRADMLGTSAPTYPSPLTYRQAANVQPFANTLVNMQMTGAQIKQALEQQWQPAGEPRPLLHLGVSQGFNYTYDPTAPAGAHITTMWLNGEPISLTESYSVTVNSFLAAGGDKFTAFTTGTQRRDTGQIDLEAMVDFMAQYEDTPLQVDYENHSIGIDFDPAISYAAGDHVVFDVSSWSLTKPTDVKDTELQVKANGVVLGTVALDNSFAPAPPGVTPADAPNDEAGRAHVDLVLPSNFSGSVYPITLTGNNTGTVTEVLPDGFAAVSPARLLDTRAGESTVDTQQAGIGAVGPDGTVKLIVAGRAGVPADAVGSVSLNVTATQATAPTFITAYPTGATQPLASNLNVLPGQTVPNVVTVPVGADGTVTLFNKFGNVHLVVDLLGWVPAGNPFAGLTPARLVDTRMGENTADGLQAGSGPITAGGELEVTVAGRGGVPATGAGAAILNVVAAQATTPTFLTVYPSGAERGVASNVNIYPGDVRPNQVIVPLGTDGKVKVYNGAGSTQVVIDVLGWVPAGETFIGVNPARLVETRSGFSTVDGEQNAIGPVGPNATITIDVAGRGGVPETGASAVALNVAYINGTEPSFITVYPTGSPQPLASNLNVKPGDIRPNMVIVPIGDDGTIKLFNRFGTVDVIVDVLAYLP